MARVRTRNRLERLHQMFFESLDDKAYEEDMAELMVRDLSRGAKP